MNSPHILSESETASLLVALEKLHDMKSQQTKPTSSISTFLAANFTQKMALGVAQKLVNSERNESSEQLKEVLHQPHFIRA